MKQQLAEDRQKEDKRMARVEAVLKRHQYRPDALLEVLHIAQEVYGYLALDLLRYVASRLHLPPSRVYGVATFYHFFSLRPKGEHTCVVCVGTACYVKGAGSVLAAAEHTAGVHAGETTADGRLTVATARCVGACGIAPAVVWDGTLIGHQTSESVDQLLRGNLAHGVG